MNVFFMAGTIPHFYSFTKCAGCKISHLQRDPVAFCTSPRVRQRPCNTFMGGHDMRTGQTHLFIPGPTNVPEDVRQAMNVPIQDMRAPDFGSLTLGLFADLKRVMQTRTGEVMIFPGSGTAAWEAAITNTLNPGDKVLMSRFGQFSTLWVDMAERLGLAVRSSTCRGAR